MKKILLGIIIGFALSLPIPFASAEVASLIGKTIEGSYPIEVDGKRAEKDVIVVEGTSYAPVRVIGELFNADVAFIDSTVIIKSKGTLTMTHTEADAISQRLAEEAAAQQAWAEEQTRIKNEIESAKWEIVRLEEEIKREEYQLEGFNRMLDDVKKIKDSMREEEYNQSIAKIEARIAEVPAKIEALKAEIANLEAQIPILEAQIQDTP